MDGRQWLAQIWKTICEKGPTHWIIFVLLIVASWYIGDYLEDSSAMIGLKYRLYQVETHLHLSAQQPPQVTVVVLLNDEDYWSEDFAARSPLNRERLGDILTTLADEGVQTVGLDVDLRSPNPACAGCDYKAYRKEDDNFAKAVQAFCKTSGNDLILGTSLRFSDGLYSEVPSLYAPWEEQYPEDVGCLHPGYLQLPHDLRQFPGQVALGNGGTLDSFAMAAVEQLPFKDPYHLAVRSPDRGFRFSNYYSEAEFRPFVFSWKTLSDMHKDHPGELRKKLAGRLVLVGGGWHTTAIGQGPQIDTYDSPMGVMPGVFLHANYIEALASNSGTFAPAPDWLIKSIEYALVVWLAYEGLDEKRQARKWIALAGGVLICFGLTEFLMHDISLFTDFLVPLCLVFGHTVVEELIAGWRELRHLRKSVTPRKHEKEHEVPS